MPDSKKLKLLLTNDDGYGSQGLIELAGEFTDDYEVYVCAPERERSAASHSITLHKPLRLEDVSEDYPDGVVEAAACSGSPTDSVALGMEEVIGGDGADIVVSGANSGRNLAEDVTYSGTVAAAMEGAVLGRPSLAVSHSDPDFLHLPTCVRLARRVVDWMADLVRSEEGSGESELGTEFRRQLLTGQVFLNLNAPAIPWDDLKGLYITHLGTREYRDVVHRNEDPRGKPYYWIAGEEIPGVEQEGSDVWALSEQAAALTPLLHDLTAEDFLHSLEELTGTWEIPETEK